FDWAIIWATHEPIVYQFGVALFHFLWQGIALGMLAAILMATLRRANPQTRYLAATLVLAAMAICPIATFFINPHAEAVAEATLHRSQAPQISEAEVKQLQG